MKLDRHTLCFLVILLLGAALYVPGLTRGDSDFVLAERAHCALPTLLDRALASGGGLAADSGYGK